MKKPVRASAPESQRSQWLERLVDAVQHLADEVRVVRDVLDETREDLSWVTRNGIPGQHSEHKRITCMARDPLAADANEHLAVVTSTPAFVNSSELSAEVFDELVSEIAEVVTVIGQEQVNLLLTALDDARTRLVAAIKTSAASPGASNEPLASPPAQESASPPTVKSSETGRLF